MNIPGIKTRIEEDSNYRAIWCDNKTIRFSIDPSKPITELKFPEFYDIKITGNCEGACDFCYMDSKLEPHYKNIVKKTRKFLDEIPKENLPFQIAYGGGEPTSHPEFTELLRVTKEEYDICPNYTTNGMFHYRDNWFEIIDATKKYCGGVAVSCHPHLESCWHNAALTFSAHKIKLNFHIIISDRESVDYFCKIFDYWNAKVEYFVLLPYGAQGRAKDKEIDWNYLIQKMPKEQSKIAFGANFYPYLMKGGHNLDVSLYQPEILSKFLDLKDMKVYTSSFSLTKKREAI